MSAANCTVATMAVQFAALIAPYALVGTLANSDTKDLGSYNLNKPGDEMRANNTSLASLFGSGAVGLGVVGPSLQSSGSTAIGAKEGLKPQTTPSASVAVVGGAATAGKVMETVDVTATASRSARLAQAAAGLRWLIGGMAAAADRNTVNASINGLPSNSCYGNCTCEWVSGNLCMSGGGKQDEMRMASHPLAGASEAATPSGPPDDGDQSSAPWKSVNQVNRDIQRGRAPSGITRADTGKVKGEQDHVHFKNENALNRDGTWKHFRSKEPLTRAQKEYLRQSGWRLPGE